MYLRTLLHFDDSLFPVYVSEHLVHNYIHVWSPWSENRKLFGTLWWHYLPLGNLMVALFSVANICAWNNWHLFAMEFMFRCLRSVACGLAHYKYLLAQVIGNNKLLPKPRMIKICEAIWRHQATVILHLCIYYEEFFLSCSDSWSTMVQIMAWLKGQRTWNATLQKSSLQPTIQNTRYFVSLVEIMTGNLCGIYDHHCKMNNYITDWIKARGVIIYVWPLMLTISGVFSEWLCVWAVVNSLIWLTQALFKRNSNAGLMFLYTWRNSTMYSTY